MSGIILPTTYYLDVVIKSKFKSIQLRGFYDSIQNSRKNTICKR